MNIKKLSGGIYLVIDPSTDEATLLDKLNSALRGGIDAVQIWDNWPRDMDRQAFINRVSALCRPIGVPLLINNEWPLLLEHTGLDGVHFDLLPSGYSEIRSQIGRPFISGITCSGDLETVDIAVENKLDYISFCAMFPSPSAGTCDIVMPATVRQASSLTTLPLFVSGGITPDNVPLLKQQTPFNGVAVISGILSADDPEEKVKGYREALHL